MLAATHANVALYNSGTLRSDRIHPRGEFTMRDLVSILPMVDNLLVLKITGRFSCLYKLFFNTVLKLT